MTQQITTDLYEVMGTQRAIRRFLPDPVPQKIIWKVLEAATKAPSGSNLQPWAFVVVRDDGKRAAIADALRIAFESRNASAFDNMEAIEDPVLRRMMQGAAALFRNFAAAPVLIVPCLVNAQSPAPEGLLAGSSIYPSVQNLLLAARAEGLGTAMTTPQEGIMGTLRAELAIPEEAIPVAMIPMGYPDTNFGPVRRRPVEEFVHWDGWNSMQARSPL